MFFPNADLLSSITGAESIFAAASKTTGVSTSSRPLVTANDPETIRIIPIAKTQYGSTISSVATSPTKPPALIDMPQSWFETEEKQVIPTKPPVLATVDKPTNTIANFTVQKTEPYTKVNQNAGIVNTPNAFTTKAEPVKNADLASTVGTSKNTASISQGTVKKTTTVPAAKTATPVTTATETVKSWPTWKKAVVVVVGIALVWLAAKYVKIK